MTFAAGRRAAAAAALLLAVLGTPARAADPPASEPVVMLDGTPYVSGASLARLLGATRFWRADVRKQVIRAGSHRAVLTVDNPFVILDSRTLLLPAPVRVHRNLLHVPVALVDSLPRDSTIARLAYEPRGRRVVRVPAGGVIPAPRLVQGEGVSRITFFSERPEEARVVGRSRRNFRLRMDGFFTGPLPDSVGAPALIEAVREIASATGSAFEFSVGASAQGWRLVRGPDRVTLEIVPRVTPEYETFAPEGPPGPRSLRVVVLDPGHGGNDSGFVAGDVAEKHLTLKLAQALRPLLESRLRARVVLTRQTDESAAGDQRAETANRVHADVFLSLHFDGAPGTKARGVTAICAPATFGARLTSSGPGLSSPVELLPWRDVATRHAVRSREIAGSVLEALELHGFGPARLHEMLPYPLLGVNAPGFLIECGTLSAPGEKARLLTDAGIAALAAAIADGLERWVEEGP